MEVRCPTMRVPNLKARAMRDLTYDESAGTANQRIQKFVKP
jgi:hypothetical protein